MHMSYTNIRMCLFEIYSGCKTPLQRKTSLHGFNWREICFKTSRSIRRERFDHHFGQHDGVTVTPGTMIKPLSN